MENYSFTRLMALFAVAMCLVLPANAGDDDYEDKFAKKFGQNQRVMWEMADKLTPEQRVEVCKSVHELTGYGPADIKETKIETAYLKYSDAKYKPILTQVLMCKKNNKHQYVYHVTQGMDGKSVTLIHPDPSKKKINNKPVFRFWWIIGSVRIVPTLQELSQKMSKL